MISPFASSHALPPSLGELNVAWFEPFWYALYTRSRHEQVVRNQLNDKGIQNFLPLYTNVSQWKDRRKIIHIPLFPGYLFVKILVQDRVQVLKSFGAVRLIGDGYNPIPIPEEQILNIQTFLEKRLRYNPHPYLKVGNKVRILDGPLSGVEGILIRKKNQCRLVLSVDLIQRSISVEIDTWNIERL
jgi:transcriptional antiterminator NusG